MKIKSVLFIAIATILLSGGCATKESFDLSMTHEGAMKWGNVTRENINRCIAVVIDGYVRSYPRVMNEITGSNTEITGNFSSAEAQYLAAILSSGGNGLPLKLQIAEKRLIKLK
jgi:SecD/SecF fusion protein